MESSHRAAGEATGDSSPSPASVRRSIFGVGLLLMVLYGATTSLGMPASIDSQTLALTAHAIAKTGSPIVPQYESIVAVPDTAGRATWVVSSPRGPVAQYPPGAPLVAVPLYLVADDDLNAVRSLSPPFPEGTGDLLLPDMWPAAVTAVLVATGAIVLIGLALVDLGLDHRFAAGIMVAVGLGTSVWSVAADALWQHGPAILMIAIVTWSLAGPHRLPWLFVATLLLPLIRPPVIAISVLGVLGASFERRDWRIGAVGFSGTSLGLVALGLYNRCLFGDFSLSGGYGAGITERALSPNVGFLMRNLWSAGFATDRGVFVWSPFLLVVALAVPLVMRRIPIWVGAMALGSVFYILFQFTVNRYGGGFDFAYYRYPLEPIMGLAPLGAFAASDLLTRSRIIGFGLRVLVGLAIVAHAYAAWRF